MTPREQAAAVAAENAKLPAVDSNGTPLEESPAEPAAPMWTNEEASAIARALDRSTDATEDSDHVVTFEQALAEEARTHGLERLMVAPADLGQGTRGTPAPAAPSEEQQIAEANARGDWATVVRLQNAKLDPDRPKPPVGLRPGAPS